MQPADRRRLSMDRCSKCVLEGILLTTDETPEVEQIVVERDLVLRLQVTAVERGIVRRDAVVHARLVEPPRHFANRLEIGERTRLDVSARTKLDADAALTQLSQQLWPVKRDLHPVTDSPQIREEFGMDEFGRRLAKMRSRRQERIGGPAAQLLL